MSLVIIIFVLYIVSFKLVYYIHWYINDITYIRDLARVVAAQLAPTDGIRETN